MDEQLLGLLTSRIDQLHQSVQSAREELCDRIDTVRVELKAHMEHEEKLFTTVQFHSFIFRAVAWVSGAATALIAAIAAAWKTWWA